ncbi:tRNA threonylcarbamoyladenosine dehydratase [Heliophilum fasciatum]|uniref:tRNA A37 threonylcarbamoyladenosine dehydratase n=1 Tax=Heliophilum fasciatum TaxID=35700 RepID=A0A4R2RPM7_9FIRM|nr:tRNA threonylcarbamoyladenosine dehydratase [Heliophilum fasciatum]MCW2278053.1 tRNA A37 threonylcarbamoyladenosine dehydratase [Heliophilum fasciatum]TCP64327.1 tRNA A37 threonylcarbamoyladenosine dehydratase [Heliophilum fasciatum]
MSEHIYSRTALLIGQDGLARLAGAKVAVFGLGGVGSYTVEALARSGVGHLVLVDHDQICLTNINRQIHALHSTVGQEKIHAMAARVRDINPAIELTLWQQFYGVEEGPAIIEADLDYVVDAIDTVRGKLAIIERAKAVGVPVISALGTGNKLDPTRLQVTDIYATTIDPLARVMRKELRKRGIDKLPVVCSTEPPVKIQGQAACGTGCVCPPASHPFGAACARKRQIPGSISFVPPVAGMLLAAEVVRQLLATR